MLYWRRNTKSVKIELHSVILKDDKDSSAVFAEYGSSASQVNVVKIMKTFQGYPDAQHKKQTQYRMPLAANNYLLN